MTADQLLASLAQWRNAPPAVRQARLDQLVQRAQARQERLASGSTVSGRSSLTIRASVTDDVGVSRVEFWGSPGMRP